MFPEVGGPAREETALQSTLALSQRRAGSGDLIRAHGSVGGDGDELLVHVELQAGEWELIRPDVLDVVRESLVEEEIRPASRRHKVPEPQHFLLPSSSLDVRANH